MEPNNEQAQPVQPAAEAPAAPVTAPASAPAPVGGDADKKNKLMKLIIAGVIAVAIIVGAFFVVQSLSGVSKDDYKKAEMAASDAKTAYNKIGSSYVSTYSTETEVKNYMDEVLKAQQDFNTKYKVLSETKAVKKDKELKKLFTALNDRKPAFDKAMSAANEAYGEILTKITGISSLGSGSEAIAKIDNLKKEFASITGLKDSNNKEFVAKMVDLLGKYETLAQKYQAMMSDYSKYDSQVSTDFYDMSTQISNAARDWQSNFEKLGKDGELGDQLNALDQALFNKTFGKN